MEHEGARRARGREVSSCRTSGSAYAQRYGDAVTRVMLRAIERENAALRDRIGERKRRGIAPLSWPLPAIPAQRQGAP